MKHIFDANHFLVAYIDVLGQSNKLMENSDYPPTKAELNKIKGNLTETSEYILSLREAFKKYFRRYRKSKGIFEGLSDEQKKNEQRMRTFVATLRGVSDSIIITVPLESKTENCIPINNTLATLQGICLIYNIALSQHKPLRGGIDVGWGTRFVQDEVYGSALVKAYTLETKNAGYPRVVIGESLWKYINYVENLKPKTQYGARARKIAQQCKALVAKDYDGALILDVIGEAAKLSGIDISPELVKEGYDYVLRTGKTCQQRGDTKLTVRYHHLKNYFDLRLNLWGITPP